MNVQYKLDGMFTNAGLTKYSKAFREQMFRATALAMDKVGKKTIEVIKGQAQAGLKIKRQAVIKSFKSKLYFRNKNQLPSLQYYSRIPWMGTHSHGATIGVSKKLIIPFSHKRIGYKAFKEILRELSQGHNLFFKHHGTTTTVWAKNTEQFKRLLAPFRKATRSYNSKVVRKGEPVVVGIMVENVRLSKKFDMEATARNSVNLISKEVSNIFKTSKMI